MNPSLLAAHTGLSETEPAPFLDELPKFDARDIASCFHLFLGRTPGDASRDGFETSGLDALLRSIFEAEEFRTIILPALLLREPLPHEHLLDTPLLPLIDWAQRRLPLSPSIRIASGAARTWAQLLELLLSDATLVAVSSSLIEAEVNTTLRQRLDNEPWARSKRSVLGCVDAASGFEVRGWAIDLCDKATPLILEFYADNVFLGTATCDEARPDVMDAIGGNGNCGFTFKISTAHRSSFAGGRTLIARDSLSRENIGAASVVYSDAAKHWDAVAATRQELLQIREALDKIEARLPDVGRIASVPIDAYAEYWDRFYRPSVHALGEQCRQAELLLYRPLISIVVPTWNSDTRLLERAIRSVCTQSYGHWELVLTDDASSTDEMKLLARRFKAEPRIRWLLDAPSRQGIAVNTNRGIAAAAGEYIAFLDHDDELAPDALFHVANALQQKKYGFLYSDEDRIEGDDLERVMHHTPFFKPDFDPDLLLSLNYICHFVVLRKDVLAATAGLRAGFEGAQDHDLLLRVAARVPAAEICHVPRILYHWRVTPGSFSRNPAALEEIQRNIVSAVREHLTMVNAVANVEPHGDPVGPPRQFATRVRWSLPAQAPKVSVIVATRDRIDLLKPCLTSVLASLGHYPGECEVMIADNDSREPETLKYFADLAATPGVEIVGYHGTFNWSAINNVAARQATGEVLVFLNNDTLVLTKDWLTELVANALRPDVGAVGARLLYPDGTIQHAGVVLGVEGVAGHECVGETLEAGGYFGRSHLLRSAAAVTGACLATRRSTFEAMDGGFDDLNLKVAFNDVDYCMRLRKAGYRVVYNPFAVLYHFESKSRGREQTETQQSRHRQEAAFFRARWSGNDGADPYYNPHFERYARPFERLSPPPSLQERH